MIKRGTQTVTKLYRGSQEVVKVYRGTQLVFQNSAPPAAKTLSSIAVTTQPTKTSYDVGDTLDLTGVVVTATYSDSTTADVTGSCTFSPANGATLSTEGTQTVSVSYTEGGVTVTTSFGVTVQATVTGSVKFGVTISNANEVSYCIRHNTTAEDAAQRQFTVDWGDGTVESYAVTPNEVSSGRYRVTADRSHSYSAGGNYEVTVSTGSPNENWTLSAIFGSNSDRSVLTSVDLTGVSGWALSTANNTALTTVHLGNNTAGGYLGGGLYKCTGLSTITFGDLAEIGNYALYGCTALGPTLEINARSIGAAAFTDCSGLREVWIRDTVETVGTHVFDSSSYIGMLPIEMIYCEVDSQPSGWAGNTNNEWNRGMGDLHPVTWGQKITPFPSYLYFTLTSELTQNLYFTQSAANGVTIDWGDGSATSTVASTKANASHTYAAAGDYIVTMTAGEGVRWSPGYSESTTHYGICGADQSGKSTTYPTLTAFVFGRGCYLDNDNNGFRNCTSLTQIKIPRYITSLPNYPFYGCTNLVDFYIPDSITDCGTLFWSKQSIGQFSGINIHIYSLSQLYTTLSGKPKQSWLSPDSGSSVTHPSDWSLYVGDTKQTSLRITESVNADSQFMYMKDVSSITFDAIPISLAAYCFQFVRTVQTLRIPSNVSFGVQCFESCPDLRNVEVASNTISKNAFLGDGSTGIEKVWIRDTVQTIVADSTHFPFSQNSNIVIYCEAASKPSGWSEYFDVISYSGSGSSATYTRAQVIWGQTTSPF